MTHLVTPGGTAHVGVAQPGREPVAVGGAHPRARCAPVPVMGGAPGVSLAWPAPPLPAPLPGFLRELRDLTFMKHQRKL